MHFISNVVLICFCLLAVAGLGTLLLIKRGQLRHRMLRTVSRELSRKQHANAKHTRAHRQQHNKAEAALFAVIKLRDAHRLDYEIAENAAEHLAALVRGD